MTKVSPKIINPKEWGNYINNLWNGFILADSKEDIRLLFKDLFTHTEYKMFAKRFEIARSVLRGSSYEEIQKKLGVTTGTIAAVNNTLWEKGDGYRKAHKKLILFEEKVEAKRLQRHKKWENPRLGRLRRKTLLGTILTTGLKTADKKIIKALKHRSAKKYLEN